MNDIHPQLLTDCVAGKRNAQYQLYKSCYGSLMSICTRYKRNEDEALATLNIGFLKILQNLNRYKKDIPFEAWCRRIMINTVIDEYRREKNERNNISYIDNYTMSQQDFNAWDYNEAEQNFDVKDIESMIQKLPNLSRQVFNLYVIDGYSHKEISNLLKMSEGTSKWHLSFARQQLRDQLKALSAKYSA